MAFISLGLPDGLLGAAWPVMHQDIHAAISLAGVVSFIIMMGTIISSLLSDRLTHRFGAGLVTSVSVAVTAMALLGFANATAFWQLCVLALPYGLGAGAVDAALNNVVALRYSAKHMSWLHCFWGVGASVGPYVMAGFLTTSSSWHGGYLTMAAIQAAIVLILFLSLPLWKKTWNNQPTQQQEEPASHKPLGLFATLRIKGVKALLIGFFSYACAEMMVMLWASTYLTEFRGLSPTLAASFASLFYIGMMSGRFINGFLAERFSDRTLIRLGIGILTIGIVLLFLPLDITAPIGLLVIGLGCAPIYPCIIHSTPILFGADHSQSIIGIEMAAAYTGSCLMPPVFGVIASHASMGLFPVFLLGFTVLVLIMIERLHRACNKNKELTT